MNTLIGEKDRRKRGEKGKQEVPLRTSEGEREGILSIHCCSHVVSLSLSHCPLCCGLDWTHCSEGDCPCFRLVYFSTF